MPSLAHDRGSLAGWLFDRTTFPFEMETERQLSCSAAGTGRRRPVYGQRIVTSTGRYLLYVLQYEEPPINQARLNVE